MTTKFIVLVSDRDDPKHGEIVVLDTGAEAERLVETFLEAGYDRERMRVFTGVEMETRVSQRPKVELVSSEGDAPPPFLPDEGDQQPEETAAEEELPLAATPGGSDGTGRGSGSRFSSLFSVRSAPAVELMPELLH